MEDCSTVQGDSNEVNNKERAESFKTVEENSMDVDNNGKCHNQTVISSSEPQLEFQKTNNTKENNSNNEGTLCWIFNIILFIKIFTYVFHLSFVKLCMNYIEKHLLQVLKWLIWLVLDSSVNEDVTQADLTEESAAEACKKLKLSKSSASTSKLDVEECKKLNSSNGETNASNSSQENQTAADNKVFHFRKLESNFRKRNYRSQNGADDIDDNSNDMPPQIENNEEQWTASGQEDDAEFVTSSSASDVQEGRLLILFPFEVLLIKFFQIEFDL